MDNLTKKKTTCSICGKIGHNKTTCPNKPIEDTRETYIEEEIIIEPRKDKLILDLLDRESYDIKGSIFKQWLFNKRPCKLKEVRYILDKGLHTESIKLYLELINDINEYY